MALNEMDARLISQNEKVTSVEGSALVPVATAEGQPQKNIALSDLANSMGAQGSEVTDIKSLWGQTADGQMVQINKASIASVLGNLLYGADNKNDLASVVAEQNTKTLEFAINDTSSTSSYYIKVEGYNEVFDHTCYGGGICIVSSQNSKTQILYTDWGVKYRLFRNGAWIDWIQITTD